MAVEGVGRSVAQLGLLSRTMIDSLQDAAVSHLSDTLELARNVYTPIDTGALRSTGILEGPTFTGPRFEIALSFGGPKAPYSVIVHERLDLSHAPPTQAKYLQRAVDEEAPKLAKVTVSAMNAAAKGVLG